MTRSWSWDMGRMVKGILFKDYVRMIRKRKDLDWSRHLTGTDLDLVASKIQLQDWYPLEAFERMGLGILDAIAGGSMEAVYAWGMRYMTDLFTTHPGLVAEGDPMDSLMRFRVMQQSFFNFDCMEVQSIECDCATLRIHYGMGPRAEQASTWQMVGFFEALLEKAGARNVKTRFVKASWKGDDSTIVTLAWEPR